MAKTNHTNNTGRKTTNIISRKRIEEVAEKLLQFWPRWKLVSHYSELWGVTDRAVDDVIAKAQTLIRSTSDNFEDVLKDRIAQGQMMILRCIEKGDLKTAATFYTALNKIGGLEKTNVDVTTGGQPLISFNYAIEPQASAHALAQAPSQIPETAQRLEIQVQDGPEGQVGCSPTKTEQTQEATNGPENEPTDQA